MSRPPTSPEPATAPLRRLAWQSARTVVSRPRAVLLLSVGLLAAAHLTRVGWQRLPRGLWLALEDGRWAPLALLLICGLACVLALTGGALVAALSRPLTLRRLPAATAIMGLGLLVMGLGLLLFVTGVLVAARLALADAPALHSAAAAAPFAASGLVMVLFALAVAPLTCCKLARDRAPLLEALGVAVLAIFARPVRCLAVAGWVTLGTLPSVGVLGHLWSETLRATLPLYAVSAPLVALPVLFGADLWGRALLADPAEEATGPCR